MEPVEKDNIGTQVILHLTNKSLVLLDEKRLQQAVKKYADFLSIPIYLNGNQINSCTPPWEKSDTEADLADYLKMRYDLYPLVIIPFNYSTPLHVDGLLFIPAIPYELSGDFGEVDIYISRMFIKANDKELLPSTTTRDLR
ncbi:MAG: hypothetical protein ACREOI_15230 [bacterium]